MMPKYSTSCHVRSTATAERFTQKINNTCLTGCRSMYAKAVSPAFCCNALNLESDVCTKSCLLNVCKFDNTAQSLPFENKAKES